MKTIPVLLTAGFLSLIGCNKSKDPEIQTLGSVAADKSQPEYIRKSVGIFEDFLRGETIAYADYKRARAELSATRNEVTLRSLIAILKSLEKSLPAQLPTEQHTMDFFKNLGDDKNLKYKINPFLALTYVQDIIPVITYFDVKDADSEVNGFFTRFEAKYGATPAGKYWLEGFRMEWSQALQARSWNYGNWKSGRKKMGLESLWKQ